MLAQVYRKLCPLLVCSLAVVACGKKPSVSTPPINSSVENQFPNSLILDYHGQDVDHDITRNANIQIPVEVKILAGDVLNKEFTVTYNLDPLFEEEYEYKCIYAPNLEGTLLLLEGCQDDLGRDFGDFGTQSFRLLKGKVIRLNVTKGSSEDLHLEIEHNISWR